MKSDCKVSYENIGSSSYLTVTFPVGMGVVGYQLEMITTNEIRHLLAASKRIVDGEDVVYYNISSRIALSQLLERRKVTRLELIQLIEGAVKVSREIKEYQLMEECLVMNPDYIYVEPASCVPFFLYLPVLPAEENGLKEFLVEMIMQGKIEMGNDNFIQVLLEELNRVPLSLEKLEACLNPFKKCQENTGDLKKQQRRIEMVSMPVETPVDIPARLEEVSIPVENIIDNKKSFTDAQRAKDGKTPPGRTKFNQKFLIPQAVLLVVLSALISFGAFTDSTGGVVLNYVLAAVICVAVIEIILYREIYVNGKGKKEKKGETSDIPAKRSNQKKPEKIGSRPMPPLPGRVKKMQEEEIPVIPNETTRKPSVPDQFVYQPGTPVREAETENSSATELWDSSEEDMTAYLEYYENGIMTRVELDKTSTLVGRLQGQADFVLTDPKVGKLHAEFINRNGEIFVKDLNSKNGTYINGNLQRLKSNVLYPLKNNDRISLAKSEFVLHCSIN